MGAARYVPAESQGRPLAPMTPHRRVRRSGSGALGRPLQHHEGTSTVAEPRTLFVTTR